MRHSLYASDSGQLVISNIYLFLDLLQNTYIGKKWDETTRHKKLKMHVIHKNGRRRYEHRKAWFKGQK